MSGPSTSWRRRSTAAAADCHDSDRLRQATDDTAVCECSADRPDEHDSTGSPRSRRAFLAGTAAVAGLSVAGTGAADEHPTITASVFPEEVSVGETTTVGLELSVVPETGVNGVTVEVDLDGAVAILTGEHDPNDDWSFTTVDLGHNEESKGDDSVGVVSVNNAGGTIEPGDTNVSLGSVEVVGVGQGSTDVNLTLEEFQDLAEDPVPEAEAVGGAQLSVSGGGTVDDSADDTDDGDDGGGSDDGGSGDGSGGDDGGDSDDGGSGDGGSAGDDSTAGSGTDDSTDGGSDDSTPGFGVATAIAAVAAGLGAKLRAAGGSDAAEGGD